MKSLAAKIADRAHCTVLERVRWSDATALRARSSFDRAISPSRQSAAQRGHMGGVLLGCGIARRQGNSRDEGSFAGGCFAATVRCGSTDGRVRHPECVSEFIKNSLSKITLPLIPGENTFERDILGEHRVLITNWRARSSYKDELATFAYETRHCRESRIDLSR